MKLSFASVFLAAALVSAKVPTKKEAALNARQLVHSNKFATISTTYPNSPDRRTPTGFEGSPIGLVDYYADCDDNGDPTVIYMPIGTAFHNAELGSNVSFSVFDPETLKAPVPADHPRFALLGKFVDVDAPFGSEEDLRLRECFRKYHPDALWTPGNPVHGRGKRWARLEVKAAYFVGGFGNHAYIGQLDVEDYHGFSRAEVYAEAAGHEEEEKKEEKPESDKDKRWKDWFGALDSQRILDPRRSVL